MAPTSGAKISENIGYFSWNSGNSFTIPASCAPSSLVGRPHEADLVPVRELTLKPALGGASDDSLVVPKERMRQLGDFEPIMESIRDIGLIEPIIVRRDTMELISGLHRLESVRALGQDEILARLIDASDVQAEMVEIDENLVRIELTALERAEHIDRRKQLYEALHPEVKHGGAPGKAGGGKEKAKGARVASFAVDTAKKTGLSRRTVQEDVQVAKLSPEAKRVVKGARADRPIACGTGLSGGDAHAALGEVQEGAVSNDPSIGTPSGLRGWISLKAAAEYLDVAPDALRRSIERHVARGHDGALEANIDGVRACKFAGRWRVKLSAAWLVDAESEDKKYSAGCGTSPSRSKHAVRPERS